MSEPITYQEVCKKFAELAISQNIQDFKGTTVEGISGYLESYGAQLFLGDDYLFSVDPELYIKHAYLKLASSSFPWVSKDTDPRKVSMEKATDKVSAMFFDAFNIYLKRCQVHSSLAGVVFDEPVNYFVKTDVPDQSPLEGPFTKVPSTFFGGKEHDFWDITFPEEHDTIIAYTNEGFLRMIMRYRGKAVMHY